MRTMVERVSTAVAQGTRSRASPNAHQGEKPDDYNSSRSRAMSWAKKFPLGSPRNDFRDSRQGAVPP